MTPTVSRLLRWAAVIAAGVALTLAAWQDPVLAYGPDRSPAAAPAAVVLFGTALGVVLGGGIVLAGWRRPAGASRRPSPSRPLSGSRPPGRRRSRR